MEPGKLRHSQEMRRHVPSEIKHDRVAMDPACCDWVTPKPVNQQPEIRSSSLYSHTSRSLIDQTLRAWFSCVPIVSQPGRGVSRWWWWRLHHWRGCPRSWCWACHRHWQCRSHYSWADRLHLKKRKNNIKRFRFSRGIFLIFGDVTPSEFQINHEIKDRNFHE